MTPEQEAREKIDDLLRQCGWDVQDYLHFNPSAAPGVALREVPVQGGRCDYLLLVDRQPVGVIEAKKAGTTLSTVADQSGFYGSNLPEVFKSVGTLPFYYESTGIETFFRDERDPFPRSRRVFAFHRPETMVCVFANDLIIAGFGDNPPRSCIIPETLGPAIVKADCIRFKPNDAASGKYLNAALNSDPVRKRTRGMVHGVGRPRLNLGEIKSIVLPIPPVAEQERIVAEVERRLSVIEELETVVTANLHRATRLRQAVLHKAFFAIF